MSTAAACCCILSAPAQTVPHGTFANPVIATDWPDPAMWKAGEWYYSVATKLKTIRRSRNLVDWEDARNFRPSERPTLLQELLWDADGWPHFKEGRPQKTERRFPLKK